MAATGPEDEGQSGCCEGDASCALLASGSHLPNQTMMPPGQSWGLFTRACVLARDPEPWQQHRVRWLGSRKPLSVGPSRADYSHHRVTQGIGQSRQHSCGSQGSLWRCPEPLAVSRAAGMVVPEGPTSWSGAPGEVGGDGRWAGELPFWKVHLSRKARSDRKQLESPQRHSRLIWECSSQQGCLFRSSTPFHSSEPLGPRPGRSLEESVMGWGGGV